MVVQGLAFRQIWDLNDALRRVCTCKAVRDKSVWTPEAIQEAAAVDLTQERSRTWAGRIASPMTFWKTVGAILTALLIWSVASFLLSVLFF